GPGPAGPPPSGTQPAAGTPTPWGSCRSSARSRSAGTCAGCPRCGRRTRLALIPSSLPVSTLGPRWADRTPPTVTPATRADNYRLSVALAGVMRSAVGQPPFPGQERWLAHRHPVLAPEGDVHRGLEPAVRHRPAPEHRLGGARGG